MCDTLVSVTDVADGGPVWFAKNSDREPGEAQVVEHLPAARHAAGARVRCTWLELPQATETHEVVLSRPVWMWGAEMGANAHGLVIGNEAVFTRLKVPKTGLTGMDLLRLALERCTAAREALDLITRLIGEYEQGGRCGHRNAGFRYHSAFILADPAEAWILETAGSFWAARRVRGVATISNVLSIQDDFDLVSEEAYPYARSRGWCRSSQDFGFARCFGDRLYRVLTGGEQRRACTLAALGGTEGRPGLSEMRAALRDHGDRIPTAGWRMEAPCAHASWLPTRHAGQTTGSMVSRLSASGSVHWLTGTSSPCLSVFKPVVLGAGSVDTGPVPTDGYDDESLFWRHEALHRTVLLDYEGRRAVFEDARAALEEPLTRPFGSGEAAPDPKTCSEAWAAHREAAANWLADVRAHAEGGRGRGGGLHRAWWKRQNRLDALPDRS
jgi:secernin